MPWATSCEPAPAARFSRCAPTSGRAPPSGSASRRIKLARLRPGVVPRRPRRRPDRLQPRPALGRLVRHVRRASASSPSPTSAASPASRGAMVAGALAPLGIVFVIFDRILDVGAYYALFSGLGADPHRDLQPVGIAGATRQNVNQLRARWRRGAAVARARRDPAGADRGTNRCSSRRAPAARRGDAATERHGAAPRPTTCRVTYGGLRAVDRPVAQGPRRRDRRADRPERRRQDQLHRRAHRLHAPPAGVIDFDGERIERPRRHTSGPARGLARTWQSVELFDDLRWARTCGSATSRRRSARLLADIVRPLANGRSGPRSAGPSSSMGLGHLADGEPTEPLARAAEAARRGPRAGRSAEAASCSTNPPPGSTPPRARRSAST